MKAVTPKHTSPVIVPIKGKDLQKDYKLSPTKAKNAVTKLSRLHAKRKAAGKITRVKGRFDPRLIDSPRSQVVLGNALAEAISLPIITL